MSLAAMRLIGFILGIFLVTLAASMVIPMITLVVHEHSDDLFAFLWSSVITFICGLLLIARGRPEMAQLRPRDIYLLTTSSWVVVSSQQPALTRTLSEVCLSNRPTKVRVSADS